MNSVIRTVLIIEVLVIFIPVSLLLLISSFIFVVSVIPIFLGEMDVGSFTWFSLTAVIFYCGWIGLLTLVKSVKLRLFKNIDISNEKDLKRGYLIGVSALFLYNLTYIATAESFIPPIDSVDSTIITLFLITFLPLLASIQLGYQFGFLTFPKRS